MTVMITLTTVVVIKNGDVLKRNLLNLGGRALEHRKCRIPTQLRVAELADKQECTERELK